MEVAVGPCEEFNVDTVRGGRRAPVPRGDELWLAFFVFFRGAEAACFITKECGVGSVNCFSVYSQPLAYLMETSRRTAKDLLPAFGTRGRVSEVLSGKRSISKEQARKLAAVFKVKADLFI